MFLSKKIKDYETKYKGKEINMSTEINSFLNIKNTVEIRVGDYVACGVIYSISMNAIKLISQEDEVLPVLAKNGNSGSLQFKSFDNIGDSPLFVHPLFVKLVNTSAYAVQDKEYNLLTLDLISAMPEDFAIKIGKLLDLKLGQNQRIHERIIINKDSLRKLNLISDKACIEINGTKHKCLIKDMSYGGALLISCFNFEGMDEGNTDLTLNFDLAGKKVFIVGKARNLSVIQTPNGKVLALGMAFCEDRIPLDYTMLIHDYFN